MTRILATLPCAIVIVSSLGCNAVLGLGEGSLGEGGGGGASTSTSASATGSDVTGTGASATTVTGATQATGTVDASSSASGSNCVLGTALQNGDFTTWSKYGPGGWSLAGNLTLESELQQVDVMEGGMRMIAAGADEVTDEVSVWQLLTLQETYFNCIEVRGASRKTSGSGHLWTRVTFNGRMLATDMPIEGQLLPFAKACRLPAAIDDYYIQVIADGIPGSSGAPGGMVVEVDHIELNHICCDNVTEDCVLAD